MFHIDPTFILALIALTLGAFLVLSAKNHKDDSAKPCVIIGYTVVILTVIVLFVSGYSMVKRNVMMKKQMYNMMKQQQGKKMPMRPGVKKPRV